MQDLNKIIGTEPSCCDIDRAAADAEVERRKSRFDRNFGIAVSMTLIVISIIFIIVDLTTLEFGNAQRILGPGAFPLFLFTIMILLNAWYLVELFTGKGSSARTDCHIEPTKVMKALRLYGLIVFALLLLNYIGFIFAMMAFTFIEMKFLSEKRLTNRMIIISTILLPLIIFFIFRFLGVNLPLPGWMAF